VSPEEDPRVNRSPIDCNEQESFQQAEYKQQFGLTADHRSKHKGLFGAALRRGPTRSQRQGRREM
jgi:hypothetical protein